MAKYGAVFVNRCSAVSPRATAFTSPTYSKVGAHALPAGQHTEVVGFPLKEQTLSALVSTRLTAQLSAGCPEKNVSLGIMLTGIGFATTKVTKRLINRVR